MGDYRFLWLILLALAVVTAVVIVFAGRALSSHNEETKKLLAEIDRMKALKDKYKDLTPQKAENADGRELLDGVNAVLQARIEKAENAEAEFACFNSAQKYAYCLYYFIEDVRQGLSFFFKNNGRELTEILLPALNAVKAEDIYPLAEAEFAMYDENNEAVSLDYRLIEDTDRKFSEIYSQNGLLENIKSYIKDNIDEF